MSRKSIWNVALLSGAVAALGGCVSEAPLSVAPGQGKTYADFQRDDAACRVTPAAPVTGSATTPATAQAAAPEANYYQCMSAKGDMVIANRTVAYPAYAAYPYPYAYPGFGYPYAYPYYGYPGSAAYLAPYVGLGIGIGIGGGYYGGGRGYYGGGRDFHGGYRGGGYRR